MNRDQKKQKVKKESVNVENPSMSKSSLQAVGPDIQAGGYILGLCGLWRQPFFALPMVGPCFFPAFGVKGKRLTCQATSA